MKKLLLATCALVLASAAVAQDIIVCKDSKRIDAQIIEVSSNEVKYKRQGNPDGPTFIISTAEINTILYADGEIWTNNYAAADKGNAPKQPKDKAVNNRQIFNFNPIGKKHPFGLTVGYTSKRLRSDLKDDSYRVGFTDIPFLVGAAYGAQTYSAALKIGVTATPEFKYGIGIQTGIFYELCMNSATYKRNIYQATHNWWGYSNDYISTAKYKLNHNEHSLAIPLRLQYRLEIIKDLSVFVYTGPEFEIGLASIFKYNCQDISDNYTQTEITAEDGKIHSDRFEDENGQFDLYKDKEMKDSYYQRFRMYWGVGAGIQYKNLQLRCGGDWGITYPYHNKSISTNANAIRVDKPFSICLSYLF